MSLRNQVKKGDWIVFSDINGVIILSDILRVSKTTNTIMIDDIKAITNADAVDLFSETTLDSHETVLAIITKENHIDSHVINEKWLAENFPELGIGQI